MRVAVVLMRVSACMRKEPTVEVTRGCGRTTPGTVRFRVFDHAKCLPRCVAGNESATQAGGGSHRGELPIFATARISVVRIRCESCDTDIVLYLSIFIPPRTLGNKGPALFTSTDSIDIISRYHWRISPMMYDIYRCFVQSVQSDPQKTGPLFIVWWGRNSQAAGGSFQELTLSLIHI